METDGVSYTIRTLEFMLCVTSLWIIVTCWPVENERNGRLGVVGYGGLGSCPLDARKVERIILLCCKKIYVF